MELRVVRVSKLWSSWRLPLMENEKLVFQVRAFCSAGLDPCRPTCRTCPPWAVRSVSSRSRPPPAAVTPASVPGRTPPRAKAPVML